MRDLLKCEVGIAEGESGEGTAMRMKRAGLLGAAITFGRSERGQRLAREARAKYDTPANRAKARDALAGLRGKRRG